MKTHGHRSRSIWQGFLLTALALLGSSLGGTNLLAATVTWSGAGGDESWSNPTNWNGGVLPTSEDDVVIDVPGNTTVRMDAFNTTVRSLQCAESFHLEIAPFRLTGGTSFINGSLRATPTFWGLDVHGAGTTLTVNGPITNLFALSAQAGGVIDLPSLSQLTVDASSTYSGYSGLFADGAGSVILATNLTNLVVSGFYYFRVEASSGGRIDLRKLKTPEGPLRVAAQHLDSLIDVSSFSGLWTLGPDYRANGWRNALVADYGGRVLIPNVTAFENVDVSVTFMTQSVLGKIGSFVAGTLTLTSCTNGLDALTNFSGNLSVSDTRLDWTNFAVLRVTNDSISISAYNGSVVDLSHVTEFDVPNGGLHLRAEQNSSIDLSALSNVVTYPPLGAQATAWNGSRIDLQRLPVSAGRLTVRSTGADSMVDLSGFDGEWATPGSIYGPSGVMATDGGAVLIPNVTSMRYLSLDIRDNAIVPTEQVRSFTEGSISLTSRTNGLEGLTNFSGSISAQNTRLDLTNFTVLYATNYSPLSFSAYEGSLIDLSRLTNVMTIGSGSGLQAAVASDSRIDLSRLKDGLLSASASDSGSQVDLSALSGVARDINLSASAAGTLLIPNVTALAGGSVNLTGDANVSLAQIGSIIDSSITLTSRTNDFWGLTNLVGSWIGVADSHLTLTNLTTLYATNGGRHISANYGSVIDLSRVTNWVSSGWPLYLYAHNGSRIDLSRLPTPEWPLYVDARYGGSVVDFSGFSGLWRGGSSIAAAYGSTVLISNVTAMENISISLSYDAPVPLAQIGSYDGGSILLYVQTNVFESLTNFSGSLQCWALGRAELPGLTQVVTTNTPASFAAYDDGLILLPNVETIAGGNVSVLASGSGAVVDLSSLTSFFSDNNAGSLSTANGGTILLSTNAMLLAGVAIDFQSNPGDILPPFLAPSSSLVLYGRPWQSYRVEWRDSSLSDSPWLLYGRVALTDVLMDLGRRPSRDLALRVYPFVADPPEVDIRRKGADSVEAILFGAPGSSYRLETRIALDPSNDWDTHATTTLTNSFAIFPFATAGHDSRFFRAVKP